MNDPSSQLATALGQLRTVLAQARRLRERLLAVRIAFLVLTVVLPNVLYHAPVARWLAAHGPHVRYGLLAIGVLSVLLYLHGSERDL